MMERKPGVPTIVRLEENNCVGFIRHFITLRSEDGVELGTYRTKPMSFNNDLEFSLPGNDNQGPILETDIKSFLQWEKKIWIQYPVSAHRSHPRLLGFFQQQWENKFVATLVKPNLPSGFSGYRRYLLFDTENQLIATSEKWEGITTEFVFRSVVDGAILAEARKTVGSKMASLICANSNWEISLNMDVMQRYGVKSELIVTLLAVKAVADMQETASIRRKAINNLFSSDSKKGEDEKH
jgi:hypothetical protein